MPLKYIQLVSSWEAVVILVLLLRTERHDIPTASGEDCHGLKLIIAYEIKLGANCCYLHINIHYRSSKNLLSITCIHTDRTS